MNFFKISSAMMHAIIVGRSGAIAMNLTVCQEQIQKQWRERVVMLYVQQLTHPLGLRGSSRARAKQSGKNRLGKHFVSSMFIRFWAALRGCSCSHLVQVYSEQGIKNNTAQ